MRIDVTYAGGAPRVIETSGESMLAGGTLGPAISPHGGGGGAVAVMLRPRLDRMCAGKGLSVEVSCWGPGPGAQHVPVSDFGHETRVPRLGYHVVWSWEVLPPAEVARAIAVDIDDRYHVRRVAGELMDLTAFLLLERRVLSDGESRSAPLHRRVGNVHAAIRRAHPDMDDTAIGDLYGLGTRLFDYARGMARASEDESGEAVAEVADEAPGGVTGSLVAVADTIGRASSWDEVVGVVLSAIADGRATLSALTRACEARGVGTGGLRDAWDEATALLGDEGQWR